MNALKHENDVSGASLPKAIFSPTASGKTVALAIELRKSFASRVDKRRFRPSFIGDGYWHGCRMPMS
ncbi:hypothetical protein KCP78_22270 [Salmonella enterica subsp. enterica]|nr:hypothetical protein KCP78_22270 [Salmonella enterica subsp. enterica]